MNRLLLALTCLLLSPLTRAQTPVSLGPVSVVATSSPKFRVFSGASVSLRQSAVRVYQDERFSSDTLETQFRDAILSGLVDRGYRLAATGEGSYEVGFVVAMSATMSNDALIEELGFSPGLSRASNQRFERGTLAVLLFEPDTDEVLWRGAIQAFADLEADLERRNQQVNLATRRLLRALKQAPR